MLTNELEVLDLSIRDGRVACAVERCKLTEQSRLVISWNDTSASDGFQPVGNGVVFVQSPQPIVAKPRTAAPDDLGGGRLAWRDTAHEGTLIVIVVLPVDYVFRSLSETRPTPVRFKIFNGRMAFYWDIGDQIKELTWAIAKRGNRNLGKLVADLNRQVINAKPIEHALVVDHTLAVSPVMSGESDRPYHMALWEKVTVTVLTCLIVLIVLFAALQKDEIPARNFVLIRIILSGAMGTWGALIPGFLSVDLSLKGKAIRAGGGLAFAVTAFFFTPVVVPNDIPNRERQKGQAVDVGGGSDTTGDAHVKMNASDRKPRKSGTSKPPPPPPRSFPSPETAGVKPLTEEQRASKDFAASKFLIQNETNKDVYLAFAYRPYKDGNTNIDVSDYKERITNEIIGGSTIEFGQENFGGPVHVSVFTWNGGWIATNKWVDLGVVPDRKLFLTEDDGVFRCRVEQVKP